MIVTLLGIFPVSAYDFQVDGIYYNLNGEEVTVTYESGGIMSNSYSDDVVIPSRITYEGKTYSVTSIGNYAFSHSTGLTSITIPNSVTSIGDYAFYYCIGLISITIPESVTSIGDEAFQDCRGLTSVTIPASVERLGPGVFSGCTNLEEIIVSADNPVYSSLEGVLYNKDKTELLQWPDRKLIVAIPNSVTRIGDCAFSFFRELTSIIIPNSVTSIGERAFEGCTGLTSITLPESVTSIGRNTFSGCSSLTTITLPESVTSIGEYAFDGCAGLTTITIPNSVTSIGEGVFSGCSGLTTITLPESLTSIGYDAFRGCSGLTAITLPESLTSIGDFAFDGCAGLTTITIPNSVTSIGEGVFSGCSGLTTITLPESLTSIGYDAFRGCSGLTAITLPESLTSIDSRAFWNCTSLTSITLPESVTNIGISAFEGCSGLASVTIGKSVTSIGDNAFAGCNRLETVTIHAVTPPEIWSNTFDDYGMPLYVPAGCKSKYQAAKYWRNFINIQETGVTLYRVEAYSSDESMGSVMGGGEYAEGTVATLAAIPASGYCFVQWSDGNTENPRQITVTEDVSLMAEFSASGRLTVSTIDDAMGGVTAVLTAIPQEGYRFARWSDGNTENPRTVVVTGSIDLVAEFEAVATGVETQSTGVNIYVVNRTLHVESVEGDYRVYTTTGQLVYAGHAATVQLADAGVYVVRTSSLSQKVVVK